MKFIESINNKTIKFVASLKMKKTRDREGLFFAEGERNVCDGAQTQIPEMIFVSEEYKGKTDFGCEVYKVPENIFKKISDTETPQGILGVFKKKAGSLSEFAGENAIILNNLRDPGNIGTILRTAKAAGFKNIILDKGCADVYSPKTVRAAMSAIFGLNIYITDDLTDSISELKKMNYTVCAADMGGKNMFETELLSPFAAILGNEANGVDESLLEKADFVLSVPMTGEIESLNAAVAGSVIMYEAARQKYHRVK